MKAGAWAGLLFVATTFFGACGGTSGEGETEPPAGSSEQALSKPNGTNGDGDYCTSGVPCVSGEGDCDSDNHCTGAGVICVNDNGPKFGQIVGNDVCAPAHCANGVKDGPETGIDCGGPCGACLSTCTGTPGGSTFCGACLCGVGQGDCDQDADCVPGLVCGALQGPKFGMGAAVDACVEPHCLNGLADAGEEGIDCGGGCGACLETCNGTEGSSSFCVGCLCSAGKGDCDADSECALGLVCAGNYGPKFGFGATTDVCVVAHCYNDVQDSGESGIDCGGECGACYLECPGNPGGDDFCTTCACASGQGDCDAERECAPGLTCAQNQGVRFGWSVPTDVCLPSHCGNDIQDVGLGETGNDCGGPCGPCLALCAGTPGATDFCVTCRCAEGQGDCDTNRECAPGLVCTPNSGAAYGLNRGTDVCTPKSCTSNANCPSDQHCSQAGQCRSDSAGCTASNQCAPGQTCQSGACQCTTCSPTCTCGAGGTCQSNADCSSGLTCSAQQCVPTCDANPSLPECIAARCANGVKDTGESDVDCGGACSDCPSGKGCGSNDDCAAGLSCGTNNGGFFGLPRSTRVCWPTACSDGVDPSECGSESSACGKNCGGVAACDPVEPLCPVGEVCKAGLGPLFDSDAVAVCVDPSCPSNDPTKCGAVDSLCGKQCICTPDCSHATAANSQDGCGDECPNVCALGQPCCTQDIHCPTGAACIAQPSGPGICRSAVCAYKHLEPPLCGVSGAPCGDTCPACTPACDGRQCGKDPVCGSSCGECGAGAFCGADGQCLTRPTVRTLTVPDGLGGTTDLAPLPPGPTSPVGALAGEFRVSEQGTALYSVPIQVPPGRAGVEPVLSLAYTGPRVDGSAGSGWKLEGLSQITRCPKIYALDGYPSPIKNDPSDSFCIDGKRLELVAGSASYGSDGAEYRTLIDTFTKVVSHTETGERVEGEAWPNVPQAVPSAQGPDYFDVWTKDGRVLRYGQTRDALILARNGARTSWLLQRVEDRAHNSMVFRYKNQRIEMPAQLPQIPAVIVTPDAIFYGGNGANNEDREVRFDYEPRVDAVTRFAQGGLPLVASTRLKGITTYAQGRAVKQYRVEYESETRSLITAIFECAGVGGGAICKPPTKFEYVNDVGFEGPLPARAAADGAQFDVNGDGIPDFFATTATVDGVRAQPLATAAFVGADIAVGVGSMYVPPPGVGALAVNVAWALAKVVLFDVLAPVPKVTYSTDIEIGSALRGGVFQSVTSNIQPCLGSTFFVDFDQDGKDEIGTVCGSNSFIAVRSLGDGNFGPFTQANVDLPPLNSMLPRPLMLDVNGDALQDLVSCSSASRLEVRLRRSPSEGFEAPLVFSGRSTPDPHNTGTLFLERVPFCGDALPSFSLNDMDGDGTPELTAFYRPSDAERGVFYQNGPAGVVRKEGTYALRLHGATLEWEAVSAVQSSIAGWSAGVISGDFNGDGLVDFWSGHDASSHLLLNTGAGFLRQTFDHPRPALTQYYPTAKFRRAGALDYDGDGKLDLIEEWTQKNGTPPNADVLLQPFKSPFPSARLLADIMVPVVSGGSRPSPIDMVRDVDGDGSADVIGGSSIFYGKGVRNGLLSKVSDGLGNEVRVDYNDAYRATCSEPQQWPEKCLKRMQGLVSGYTTGFTYESDGIGYFKDEHHYTYTYENARLSMTGHGWLGFDKVVVKENTSGAGAQVTTSTSEFTPLARYTPSGAKATGTAPPYLYPLAGLAKVVTVDQSGSDQGVPTLEDAAHSRRTRKTNHWSVAVSASGRPYPTLDFAETLTFSRPFSGSDGAPVGPDDDGRTRTRCYEMNGNFDGYGNARGTSRGCTQLDGNGDAPQDLEVTWTNVDSFLQDTSAWLISHPSNSHIESYRYPAAPGTIEAQDYSYSYDSLGQLASVIRDPLGDNEQTIYAHDDHGNVMSITHRAPGELDRVTSIIYDDAKLFPVLVTNPEGHATQVSFAADFGQMLGLVDPNGVSVQHSYDGFGRRTLSIDPTGSTLYTFAAQPDTQVKIASDYYVYPRAMVTVEQQDTAHRFAGHSEQLLDNHGRVVRATTFGFQGREVKSDRAFDPRGRVVATIAPRTASDPAAITTYEYDYLDRVWRTTLPDGAVSEHRYGSTVHLGGAYQRLLNGFTCAGTFYSEGPGPTEECAVDVELMSEPHKAGEVVRESALVRDFDGLIVRTIDGENSSSAAPKTSDFEYQPFGRLTKLRANDGTVSTLLHDPYGRLTYQRDPDTLGTIYTYNPFGEVKTSLEGYTVQRAFGYDRLGRVTSVVDGNGSCDTPDRTGCSEWIYDRGTSAIGQLSESVSPPTAENAAGQHVLYSYEPATSTSRRALLKSLTYAIDGVSYTIGIHYDDQARTEQVDFPDLGSGAQIKARYGYDDLSGALNSVSEVGGNATRFIWGVRDAFQAQLPSSIEFGNGAVSTISYDPQRRFLKAIETKLNGETVQNLSYDRYGNGQVKELLNTRGAQTDRFSYEYDLVGRLAQTKQVSSVQPDDVDKSYGYDVHGNLNNFAGRIITFPDATPHLPSAVGSTAYTHVNGNLTSRTGADVPGSSQVFTYTPFNLPKTITTGTINPRLTQLDYTADEQRVVRRDPDRTHHFAGDLYERVSSPSGATLEEHFRLPAGATIVAEIIRTPAGDQTLYFHPDALGTPETLTDASGTVTHQSFDPFGARPDGSATLATRIGYTGQHQDDDLALIDMGGRVYDPLAGRFTTADPVLQAPYSSQGQNRYAYVFNDPINLTDPSGFSADGVGAGGGAFAGELLIGGLARASISSGALTGAGIGGGVAGGAANVVGTLLANPFVGSSGGTYGAAAPSGAQNSNPVKPGGMNAVGQGRPPGAAAVQERGLPRYEGGAPGVPSGEGGNGGAGGLAPNAAGRFDPGSYVDYDRLSPTARRLLRPIFDRFGYDVARIRIRFDAEVSTADTNGDLIRINPDLWSNPKWNNYKRMQLLTHEVTHSVQFQNLGSGAMRWRVGVERVTHVFGDVYDVPNRLADTPLAGINVVDPRFTLEGIAARMEDFARTVPP